MKKVLIAILAFAAGAGGVYLFIRKYGTMFSIDRLAAEHMPRSPSKTAEDAPDSSPESSEPTD